MPRSGTFPSQLRLNVQQVPSSFDGNLYCILGPGLGDTVNDFRILHELSNLYRQAIPIVYADPRWKDLYSTVPALKGVSIRYHRSAPSGEREGKAKQRPYHRVFREMITEICEESRSTKGFVALGAFKCLDQLARNESSISMKGRAIGLTIPSERCRPFSPIGDSEVRRACAFLDGHGLKPGTYVAIAPHTFADKMWGHEAWETLIQCLVEGGPLPILVVGLPGYPSLKGPLVVEALGQPLSLVAGLISQAQLFVGLDSGLSHLAASFNIPLVTLNPQGRFPPFLVEAQSPLNWTHLTPGMYGNQPISPTSVFEVVSRALTLEKPLQCPICQKLPYVLKAEKNRMLYLCRCGLMFRDFQYPKREDISRGDIVSVCSLPTKVHDILKIRENLLQKNIKGSGTNDKMVTIQFEHWNSRQQCLDSLLSDPSAREVWWNFDAVHRFLQACGWTVTESQVRPMVPKIRGVFFITVKVISFSHTVRDEKLQVPWGENIIHVPHSIYEKWLRWECFQKQEELEGLGWMLTNEGMEQEGREILRLAVRLGSRGRSIRRLVRAEWKMLRRKLTF